MAEKILLKSRNFRDRLERMLHSMRDTGIFTDVTLACDDGQVEAHRAILASNSPVLDSLIQSNPEQSNKEVCLLIHLEVTIDVLHLILDFIYKGSVEVAPGKLKAFMKAADDLKVEGLCEEISEEKNCVSKQKTWEDNIFEGQFTKEDVDDRHENTYGELKSEVDPHLNEDVTNILTNHSTEQSSEEKTDDDNKGQQFYEEENEKPQFHSKVKITRSPVYDYFTKNLTAGTQTCNQCGFVLKGTNPTAAKQHLKGRHKDLYQEFRTKNRQAQDAANAMQTDLPEVANKKYTIYREILNDASQLKKIKSDNEMGGENDTDELKESIGKNQRTKVKRSPVYDYFTKDKAAGTQICHSCQFVSRTTNPSAAAKHLEAFHPLLFNEFQVKRKLALESIAANNFSLKKLVRTFHESV